MVTGKLRIFSVVAAMVISLMALASIASAAPISAIQEVKIDGDVLGDSGTSNILGLDKEDELDVKVKIESAVALDDVQVEAFLRGYDHDDLIEDITDVFDVKAGITYYKTLNLKLPSRMDQDRYMLRIVVSDRRSEAEIKNYELEIDAERHNIDINRIVLSPENEVRAGRALLTSVRVKNRGETQEEDIVVSVSIPELGISGTDIIDEIDEEGGSDDSVTSEEIYMRIPDSARTGEYTLRVEVEYDDGDEVVSQTMPIFVLGMESEDREPADREKAKITVGPSIQDIKKGETKTYFVTVENMGTSSRVYSVSVDGAVWADYTISPTAVDSIDSDESKTFSVAITPKDTAAAGQNAFTVSVKVGDKTEQAALTANVIEAEKPAGDSWGSIKRALEIGLVVLVVLLVILGLIIGFNKLKGDDEEGKEEGSQTYY